MYKVVIRYMTRLKQQNYLKSLPKFSLVTCCFSTYLIKWLSCHLL